MNEYFTDAPTIHFRFDLADELDCLEALRTPAMPQFFEGMQRLGIPPGKADYQAYLRRVLAGPYR